MSTRWRRRRVVNRFAAVTILLSALSVGGIAFAPWGSAATQPSPTLTIREGAVPTTQPGGTTNVPGKNPHGRLCKKVRTVDLALRNLAPNIKKAESGNWSAFQKFLLAYDQFLSDTAQAVIDAGTKVPAGVSTAARKEVSNINVLQKLIRKARNTAGLTKSMNDPGTSDLISAEVPVLDYVAGQCGSTQGSTSGTEQLPVTLSPNQSQTLTPGTSVFVR
jgi:hypothetical protein